MKLMNLIKSSNKIIFIRGLDKEERKELTNAVLHYRLDTV
jgi:hypothetical protein